MRRRAAATTEFERGPRARAGRSSRSGPDRLPATIRSRGSRCGRSSAAASPSSPWRGAQHDRALRRARGGEGSDRELHAFGRTGSRTDRGGRSARPLPGCARRRVRYGPGRLGRGVARAPFDNDVLARHRLGTVTAVRLAARAVDLLHDAAGMNAVMNDSVLDRCWRDVHTMTQHIILSPALRDRRPGADGP